jgi:BMFP domain-containing protein YqiC
VPKNRELVERAIEQFQVQGLNFGYEAIRNGAVRAEYIRTIKEMADDMKLAYEAGRYSAEEAARLAHQARNTILDASRARQTTLGHAVSKAMKEEGRALGELIEHYAQQKYGRAFQHLDEVQREAVFVEIIEASGRARKSATTLAARLRWGGRVFWVFTLGVAVYNIGSAENKAWAAGREGATLGGGFAGGAGGGALAGVWFGPIGIAVGIAVGGVLGALLADEAYTGIAGPEIVETRAILSKYIGVFRADEEGIAKALITKSGINMDEVYVVFIELANNYSGDSDDVARHYVKLARQRGGALVHALRLHAPLRNLLVRILDEGWTTDGEYGAMAYLRQLGRP